MKDAPHNARIMGPIPFITATGQPLVLPIGPCLIERLDAQQFDICWGSAGEMSAVLQLSEVKAADSGFLVLLD